MSFSQRNERKTPTQAVVDALRTFEKGGDYHEAEQAAALGYGHADNLLAWAYDHGLLDRRTKTVEATDGSKLLAFDARPRLSAKGRRWLAAYDPASDDYAATD